MIANRQSLLALVMFVSGCSWFTDFKQQPKIDPWETPDTTIAYRGNPQGSVPITGTFVADWQVSHAPMPATIDSMSGLVNPTPPNDSSLANGRRYFQINCAVCHGDAARGDGPATRYGMAGINLLTDLTKARTDGYIFGMIRNGRGIMPPYDRIEEMDRWDVVNYVRGLQGKLGHDVPIGPVGYPGQTGTALPGYTQTGPQRPVPYFHPQQRRTTARSRDAITLPGQQPARSDSAASQGTNP